MKKHINIDDLIKIDGAGSPSKKKEVKVQASNSQINKILERWKLDIYSNFKLGLVEAYSKIKTKGGVIITNVILESKNETTTSTSIS